MIFSLILNILSAIAVIIIGFVIVSVPSVACAQSTSSGDILPGRGVMIVNHQAVIDSAIVMMAQRAGDSITALKNSILTKTTLTAALAALSLTTTGSTGAASYNSSTGALNIPQYAGTVTSVGMSSSDLSVSGSPVTASGSITVNLSTTGVAAGTYGLLTVDTKGRVTAGKRTETYSGTTNSSGLYTVTFGTSYSATPNIQYVTGVGGTNKETILIKDSSTTGFTIYVQARTDVVGLLPSYANVNGRAVDVLVTEK